MLSTLWMGCIGFLDDYLKIVQGKSRGLVAKWKLAGQVSFGLLLGLFLAFNPVVPEGDDSRHRYYASILQVPGGQLCALALCRFRYGCDHRGSNAVNLTDGLDGLATGLPA